MWFFTLLLLFYATYPLLRRAARTRRGAMLLLAAAFVAGVVLDRYVRMGHELWLTALGFVYGVASHSLAIRLRPWASGLLALGAVASIAVVRWALHVSWLNFPLIAAASMLLVEFVKGVDVPRAAARLCAPLSRPLLEIYILHPYVLEICRRAFPTRIPAVDLLVSLACVLAAAWSVRLAVAGLRRAVAPARR